MYQNKNSKNIKDQNETQFTAFAFLKENKKENLSSHWLLFPLVTFFEYLLALSVYSKDDVEKGGKLYEAE